MKYGLRCAVTNLHAPHAAGLSSSRRAAGKTGWSCWRPALGSSSCNAARSIDHLGIREVQCSSLLMPLTGSIDARRVIQTTRQFKGTINFFPLRGRDGEEEEGVARRGHLDLLRPERAQTTTTKASNSMELIRFI